MDWGLQPPTSPAGWWTKQPSQTPLGSAGTTLLSHLAHCKRYAARDTRSIGGLSNSSKSTVRGVYVCVCLCVCAHVCLCCVCACVCVCARACVFVFVSFLFLVFLFLRLFLIGCRCACVGAGLHVFVGGALLGWFEGQPSLVLLGGLPPYGDKPI